MSFDAVKLVNDVHGNHPSIDLPSLTAYVNALEASSPLITYDIALLFTAKNFGFPVTVTTVTGPTEWVGDAVAAAGKAVETGIDAVATATGAIGDALGKIPAIGPLFHAALGAAAAPWNVAKDVADGKRLDRVMVDSFNRELKNVKEIAPYAQVVISFVPGVGPIASAAIGMGLAIAEGQGIDEILIAGVKGALPGGPLAVAAFDTARGAVEGKDISQSLIKGLGAAVHIPAEAQEAIIAGFDIVRRASNGERVDVAAADVLIQRGQDMIPDLTDDERKALSTAFSTGAAIAQGKKLQDVITNHVPELLPALEAKGLSMSKMDVVVGAARNALPSDVGKKGWDIGVGIMTNQVGIQQFNVIRNALYGDDLKGFDMAVSLHIGRALKVPPSRLRAVSAVHMQRESIQAARNVNVGYAITRGMMRATPRQKSGMMQSLARIAPMRDGAVIAIHEIAAARHESWWTEFWRWLKGLI